MKYLKVGFVFLGLVLSKYANGFSYCKNDDPNFDTCLAKGIEDAVKSFKSGSSELGLKPIDPLPVDKITLGSGGGAVNLVQYYDGVSVHGLTNIKVTKAHYDKSKKTLAIENVFPKLSQKGHYKVNGAILSLPVQGDGQSTLDLENCEIKLDFQLSEDTKGGEKYFKIKSLKASIRPKKVQMHFENLFNGNKLLGDNINKVINEEWETLYKDVQADTEKSYANIFKSYAQEFFDKVPVNKIFP